MAGMLYCAKSSSFHDLTCCPQHPYFSLYLGHSFMPPGDPWLSSLCKKEMFLFICGGGGGGGVCTDLMLGASNFQNADRLCPKFILLLRQPPAPRPGLSSPCPLQPTLGAWQGKGLGVKIPGGEVGSAQVH